MPELHPGPEVSLGMLEAQLRELGLTYNAGYFLTTVDGHWVLSVSDENYARWQERFGSAESTEDSGDEESDEESTEDDATEDDTDASKVGGSTTPAKSKTATRRTGGSKTRGR